MIDGSKVFYYAISTPVAIEHLDTTGNKSMLSKRYFFITNVILSFENIVV